MYLKGSGCVEMHTKQTKYTTVKGRYIIQILEDIKVGQVEYIENVDRYHREMEDLD